MDQLLLQWDCFMSDVIICTITWLPVMTCEACCARLSLRLNWHYYITVLSSSLHHYSYCISKYIWTDFICMSVQAIDTEGPIYVGLWTALSWGEKQAIQSIWEESNHPILFSQAIPCCTHFFTCTLIGLGTLRSICHKRVLYSVVKVVMGGDWIDRPMKCHLE